MIDDEKTKLRVVWLDGLRPHTPVSRHAPRAINQRKQYLIVDGASLDTQQPKTGIMGLLAWRLYMDNGCVVVAR